MMRGLLLLFAFSFATAPLTARAQHLPRGATGHAGGGANAMQNQMRQMQQQQHMMRQQQQALQQQQRAQQQMLQQQQQQHRLQQQQAQGQQRVNAAARPSNALKGPGTTGHQAAAGKGQATRGHTAQGHQNTGTHVVRRPHWLHTWPASTSASYRRLTRLKKALDAIATNPTPTATQRAALRNSLNGVVEVSARPPSSQVGQLTNHLTAALAGRAGAGVDTGQLALHLRAVMNSSLLSPADFALSRDAFTAASLNAAHLEQLSGSLHAFAPAGQVQSR